MRTHHGVACTLPIFSTKGHESSAHVMSMGQKYFGVVLFCII